MKENTQYYRFLGREKWKEGGRRRGKKEGCIDSCT